MKAFNSATEEHELQFISFNSRDPSTIKDRKLIRSHVMRGKNQRKRAAERPKLSSWINQEDSSSTIPPLESVACPGQCYPLPPKIGSNMQITQFACDMPQYAVKLISEC